MEPKLNIEDFKFKYDLNHYFNATNIPNQNLVFETYNFFKKGNGKDLFEELAFLNLLNWHYKFLVSQIEKPFDILNQLNSLPVSEIQLHTLKGFILKWFGGYPVNNLNTQFNTVLKLIEEEYLEYVRKTLAELSPFVDTEVLEGKNLRNKVLSNQERSYIYLKNLNDIVSNTPLVEIQNAPTKIVEIKSSKVVMPEHQLKENYLRLFISHSRKDVEIVNLFCDKILRLSLQIDPENIFCTSIEAYSITTGSNFRDVIKDQLKNATHVIQIITKNYKESEVCLNEMGAAWVLNNKVIPFILNPIGYKNVGFIHSVNQILKLGETKDLLKFVDEMNSSGTKLIHTEVIRHISDFTAFIKQENEIQQLGNVKIEIEASFPGGEDEWRKYLKKSLNAQIAADNDAPRGKYIVIIRFIIDKDGYLIEVLPTTNHGYGMEEEALRVIKNSPKWLPAFQNNKNVNAYRRQPVAFVVE